MFLLFALTISTTNVSGESVSYPALKKGVYLTYNVTKPASMAYYAYKGLTLRYWDWRYEVLDVNDTYAKLMVNHTEYINGTPVSSGGYITYINYAGIHWFEVFFDASDINSSIELFISNIVPRGNGTWSMKKIDYYFNNTVLKCINASYRNFADNSYGYFVISIDYGVMIEKVQFRFESYTGNFSVSQLLPIEKMVLKDTNLFSLAKKYPLLLIIAIVVIVAIVVTVYYYRGVRK